MARFDAVFNLEDRMSDRLRRINQNLESSRRALELNNNILGQFGQTATYVYGTQWRNHINNINASNAALRGHDVVLRNITRRLNESRNAMTLFNGASNPQQALRGFAHLERAILQSRRELSRLGFGRSKMEIQMAEAQLHNFANIRFKNLQDEIKRTEQAIKQMQSSPNSSRFQAEIASAEQALSGYRRRLLEETDAVRRMAEVNGYRVARMMGADVIYKPFSSSLDRMTGRLNQFVNGDLQRLSQVAYNSIDRNIKKMVGATDGVMDQRRKVMQLQNAYMMLSQTVSMFAFPILGLVTAAIGIMTYTFEQASTKFAGMTITPKVDMSDYSQMMDRIFVDVGSSMSDISDTMARALNDGVSKANLESYTREALTLAEVWGANGYEMLSAITNAQDALGSNRGTANNAMALAMKVTNGEITKANELISDFGKEYKTIMSGGNVDIGGLTKKATAIAKLEYKEYTGSDKNQLITEYVSEVVDSFERLNDLKLEQKTMAFDIVDNATGPMAEVINAFNALGIVVNTIFKQLGPVVEKFAKTIKDLAMRFNELLIANPIIAKTLAYVTALTLGLVAFIAIMAPVSFVLMKARYGFQALSQGLKLASRGVVVANPQFVMMTKIFNNYKNAILGMPRMLLSLVPVLATLARMAPMALLKFMIDFAKMNPMLLVLSAAGLLIYKNWDRVAPLFERIKDAFSLAIQPIKDFFEATSESDGASKFGDMLENIATFAGDVLVDALEVAVPLLEALAKILNGDFDGASKSIAEANDALLDMIGGMFDNFDFAGAVDFGMDLATSILTGMGEVFSNGLEHLIQYNTEAFKSGDGNKIMSALLADAVAMYFGGKVLATAGGAAIKGYKGVKNTAETVTNAGSKVKNTASSVASGARNAWTVATNPVGTARAFNRTNAGDIRAGYQLMREEGAGRIRSLFGGLKLAQGGPQVNNMQTASTALKDGAKALGGSILKFGSKVVMPATIAYSAYKVSKAEEGSERQKAVGSAVGGIGGALVGAKAGAMGGAAIGTALGGPVGTAIGGAVGGIGGSIVGSLGGSKLGASIASSWDEIKAGGASALDWISKKASDAGEAISGAFSSSKDWAVEKLEGITDWFAELPDRVGTFLEELPYKAGYAFGEFVIASGEILSGFIEWVGTIPGMVITYFSNLGSDIGVFFGQVYDSAVVWFGSALDWISTVPGSIGTFFVNLPTTLGTIFTTIYTNASKSFDDILTAVGDFITSIPGKISSGLEVIVSAAKGIGSSIISGIKQGWDSAWSGLGSVAKWALEKASQGISVTVDMFNDFNKGYSDSIGGKPAKNAMGGFVDPLNPDGGRVTRSTYVAGGNGIAGEAGAEMIIPLGMSRRTRALQLFNQTASYLGLQKFANGGFTDEDITPNGNIGNGGNFDSSRVLEATNKEVRIEKPSNEGSGTTIENLFGSITINTLQDIEMIIQMLREYLLKQYNSGGGGLYGD